MRLLKRAAIALLATSPFLVLPTTSTEAAYQIFVGYADDLRTGFFPTPWEGDPGVSTFVGSTAPEGTWDAGAIMILNTGSNDIVFNSLTVDGFANGASFTLWNGFAGTVIPPGTSMILTQTAAWNFDTSDQPINTGGRNGAIPRLTLTVDGVTATLFDTCQVLNTEGTDPGILNINESRQWRPIATHCGNLDHFLSYIALSSTGSPHFDKIKRLQVQDQFQSTPVLFDVLRPLSLCNPASKDGVPVGDGGVHLVGYQVVPSPTIPPQPQPHRRHVAIVNQFHPTDPLLLNVDKPDRLLVPSAKCVDRPGQTCPTPLPSLQPVGSGVDHFMCYRVTLASGTRFPKGLRATVADQFQSPKLFDILSASRLCTPTNKKNEGVLNASAHLMCYNIRPTPPRRWNAKVSDIHVDNQFGPDELDATKEDELCVPSGKVVLP